MLNPLDPDLKDLFLLKLLLSLDFQGVADLKGLANAGLSPAVEAPLYDVEGDLLKDEEPVLNVAEEAGLGEVEEPNFFGPDEVLLELPYDFGLEELKPDDRLGR